MNLREVFECRKTDVLSVRHEMTDLDNPPTADRLQQLKETHQRLWHLYADALVNLRAGGADMSHVDLLR